MNKKRVLLTVATAVTVGVFASASACSTHQDAPAPAAHCPEICDGTHIRVTNMPDGYRNVVSACDQYGNMLFVTSAGSDDTRPSGIFVVPNDLHCK